MSEYRHDHLSHYVCFRPQNRCKNLPENTRVGRQCFVSDSPSAAVNDGQCCDGRLSFSRLL